MLILCDIDGTAANINHRRHFVENKPKRWDKFYDAMTKDVPNAWCQELLRALVLDGHQVAFVSGRPDNYRKQTHNWLMEHYQDVGVYSLYMRPADNTEQDFVIKERIYNEHFANTPILFVIDDRQQVVNMWRSKGLTVLQCDEGNF